MKNFRLFKRVIKIVVGAIGVTTLFSACHKERDCKCTYTEDGDSYIAIVQTKEQCWELDKEVTYDGDLLYTIECEKD